MYPSQHAVELGLSVTARTGRIDGLHFELVLNVYLQCLNALAAMQIVMGLRKMQ